jgi:DNA-3-methyladenine glycosylase I
VYAASPGARPGKEEEGGNLDASESLRCALAGAAECDEAARDPARDAPARLLPSAPVAKATRSGLAPGSDGNVRCFWCAGDPLYEAYHDDEWGFPVRDDVRLFEKICLEGFQAGLSWITVLRKREAFRRAFHGFDPERVARMNARTIERLLCDPGIIRHKGKLESAVNNARRTLELVEARGSLATHLWEFEPDARERPKRITWPALGKLTETPASRALSKDLRQRGFSFVGPTTMYAMMQAVGLVNDHLEGCPTRERAGQARARFRVPQ